jgi:hypothetical protein
MAESVAQRVMQQYPTLAFLLNDPEVGKLLTQAVDPNAGFDPATFQAKLYQTRWWRTRSQAQRQWEITRHTDVGEATQQRKAYRAELAALGSSLGISFSSDQLKLFSESGLGLGIQANSQQMLNHLMKLRKGPQNTRPGTIDNLRHQIRGMANSTFMVPMSTTTADRLAEAVASGNRTMEGIEASLRIQAARMYPHLKTHIDRGETMADITDSYKELIAQELEVDANRVDLFSNPYWNKVVNHKPDPNGETRMMTMQEALSHARSRPEYWKTQGGKALSAQFSSSLLDVFGKRRGSIAGAFS